MTGSYAYKEVSISLTTDNQLYSETISLSPYYQFSITLSDATLAQKVAAANVSVKITFNSTSLTEMSNSSG